jgi:hypothetical protein
MRQRDPDAGHQKKDDDTADGANPSARMRK